jgi:hypothetical protein
MQMRNFLLGTLSFALLSAVPLRATIINTTLTPFTGDPAEVLVIADDVSNPGFVQLTVELTSPSSGDISALYFFLDIDPFPASLDITGADVTATALAQGGVSAVGGDFNNMNPFCCFDGGIAFGGPGDDGIVLTVVDIADLGGTLTASSFTSFGARVMSLPDGGSSKLFGGADDPVLIPEPGTWAMFGGGLLLVWLARRFRPA